MIGLELFEQEFDHLKFIRITYMESSGVVQDFSEPRQVDQRRSGTRRAESNSSDPATPIELCSCFKPRFSLATLANL